MLRLDVDGKEREFDGKGLDSSGATFISASSDSIGGKVTCPDPAEPSIVAFTPSRDGKRGVTIAEYEIFSGGI